MYGNLETPKYLNSSLANQEFDFIMCDAFFAYAGENWGLFDCPKAMLIEDVHMEVPKWQVDLGHKIGIDIIFHRFYNSFHRYHPSAADNYECIWLPHSIDPKLFYDRGYEREHVLHLGIYNEQHYPIRLEVVNNLSHWSEFKAIPRPSESLDGRYKWPVMDEYAEIVCGAKICVTGGSRYDAPVMKYFEIPACGTPLMTNWFDDLGLLGFVPGKNILVYPENYVEYIKKIYDDDAYLEKISNSGVSLINERHTVDKRALQFVKILEKIVYERCH